MPLKLPSDIAVLKCVINHYVYVKAYKVHKLSINKVSWCTYMLTQNSRVRGRRIERLEPVWAPQQDSVLETKLWGQKDSSAF